MKRKNSSVVLFVPGACKRTPVSCNEEALHYGVYERPSVDFSMLNQIVQSLCQSGKPN